MAPYDVLHTVTRVISYLSHISINEQIGAKSYRGIIGLNRFTCDKAFATYEYRDHYIHIYRDRILIQIRIFKSDRSCVKDLRRTTREVSLAIFFKFILVYVARAKINTNN